MRQVREEEAPFIFVLALSQVLLHVPLSDRHLTVSVVNERPELP